MSLPTLIPANKSSQELYKVKHDYKAEGNKQEKSEQQADSLLEVYFPS